MRLWATLLGMVRYRLRAGIPTGRRLPNAHALFYTLYSRAGFPKRGFLHLLVVLFSISVGAKGYSVFCFACGALLFSVNLLSIVSALSYCRYCESAKISLIILTVRYIKKVGNHCSRAASNYGSPDAASMKLLHDKDSLLRHGSTLHRVMKCCFSKRGCRT